MVSFKWYQPSLVTATSGMAAANYLPIVLDNDNVLVRPSSIVYRSVSPYTTWTNVLAGVGGDVSVFLDMGSGNVWITYKDTLKEIFTQESDDYGATWNGEVKITDGVDNLNYTDMFKIGTDAFICATLAGGTSYRVYKWNSGGGTWDIQDTLATTDATLAVSRGLVIGTAFYFVGFNDAGGDAGAVIYKYEHSTTTLSKEGVIIDGWFSEGRLEESVLFKGTDSIWYIKLTSGVNYRLYRTDDIGASWTYVTSPSSWYFVPSNYQRAGDEKWSWKWLAGDSTAYVFKYLEKNDMFIHLYREEDIAGYDFNALCSLPLFFYSSGAETQVYGLTDKMIQLGTARASYQTHRTPKGRFSYALELQTDRVIEIIEDTGGTEVFAFRGKMDFFPPPKYDQRRALWNYSLNNMGFDDLQERVSYDAVAEGIDEVVLALFEQLTNPYLYADATSVPNIATNMTYKFDKVRFKDALYICCILGNAYPFHLPNGYSYFRAYSNPPDSGDTYSNGAGNMGNPEVNKHQAQFNDFSNVRGGMDLANGRPFEPTSGTETIAEHVQQYGKKLWRGRTLFSGALTQSDFDAIIAGLKAWQGMTDNPIDASFKVKQYYYPVGYKASVQFTLNNLIPDATDMIIVGNLTNFKKPNLIDLATSTNIVRRR